MGLPPLNTTTEIRLEEYDGWKPCNVGVDVHKNFSFVCAMEENGEIILEKKVRIEDLEKFLGSISGNKTIILEPSISGFEVISWLIGLTFATFVIHFYRGIVNK